MLAGNPFKFFATVVLVFIRDAVKALLRKLVRNG